MAAANQPSQPALDRPPLRVADQNESSVKADQSEQVRMLRSLTALVTWHGRQSKRERHRRPSSWPRQQSGSKHHNTDSTPQRDVHRLRCFDLNSALVLNEWREDNLGPPQSGKQIAHTLHSHRLELALTTATADRYHLTIISHSRSSLLDPLLARDRLHRARQHSLLCRRNPPRPRSGTAADPSRSDASPSRSNRPSWTRTSPSPTRPR